MIPSEPNPCAYYSNKSSNKDVKSTMTEIGVTGRRYVNGNGDREECRDNKVGRWCCGLAPKERLGGIGGWEIAGFESCGQSGFIVLR